MRPKAGRGRRSLLAGLLRCRRSGRMLHVTYSASHGEVPRYHCRGALVNHGEPRYISFGGAARLGSSLVSPNLPAHCRASENQIDALPITLTSDMLRCPRTPALTCVSGASGSQSGRGSVSAWLSFWELHIDLPTVQHFPLIGRYPLPRRTAFGASLEARRTIPDYEAVHMIRKGQVRWLPKGDVSGQVLFINLALWAEDRLTRSASHAEKRASSLLFATLPLLVSAFAAPGLILAAIGLYAVISH